MTPSRWFHNDNILIWHTWRIWCLCYTGGDRTMVVAATIVSMAAAKKAQQNVFALYHSYNRTILLGFIWILDFHFKIVLVLRRHYLIPIRCNNGKRKMWPWRWLHHFDFQHWRWLHALMTMVALFRAGNFWHTHSPLQRNMLIGCMIVVKCDTCKISGAYAHLDSITSTVVILVIGIACRSLILIKNVYFIYFLPNSKLIYGWSDTTNFNCHWVQNIVNFKEW